VRTFDAHAAAAFRAWLRTKYGSLSALNEKQGRVFWSSQFEQWADVSPPTHEVTEVRLSLSRRLHRFRVRLGKQFAGQLA
jgi:beta-galactosidase